MSLALPRWVRRLWRRETANTSQPDRRFRFTYETTVPPFETAQDAVDVWIPMPHDTPQQDVTAVAIDCTIPFAESVEPATGNRILHVRVPRGDQGTPIRYSCDVVRRRWCVPVPPPAPLEIAPDDAPHLAANAKVPTDGFILERLHGVLRKGDAPVVTVRRVFDHLIATLAYDRRGCTPERAHELGDLQKACDAQSGTCTEFHGIFVGMCRAAGIPARFRFGFNVPFDKPEGWIGGYHCWAEVRLPGAGWFPIDVTEAIKEEVRGGNPDFFFGGLNCHRVELTTGRDVAVVPPAPRPLDKLIFSHAVRGDEEIDTIVTFRFAT